MAQGFAWKDFLSLPRYRDQQQYLDNELRLLYAPGLFSSVLLSVMAPSSSFYTTVQHLENTEFPNLVGQLYHPAQQATARLSFLAPKSVSSHTGFSRLLAHLSKQAGERGAFQILAEVPQGKPIEETLYQAGFRPYTEQQIWKFVNDKQHNTPRTTWCPVAAQHQEKVVALYNRVTPHPVLRVEPPPRFQKLPGLVTVHENQVVACGLPRFGPSAILIDLIVDPGLEELEDHLVALIDRLPGGYTKDVYFRVRTYQERISTTLESLGAAASEPQRVVVKKLALHYNAKQTYTYHRFKKQPDITTPISNSTLKK